MVCFFEVRSSKWNTSEYVGVSLCYRRKFVYCTVVASRFLSPHGSVISWFEHRGREKTLVPSKWHIIISNRNTKHHHKNGTPAYVSLADDCTLSPR